MLKIGAAVVFLVWLAYSVPVLIAPIIALVGGLAYMSYQQEKQNKAVFDTLLIEALSKRAGPADQAIGLKLARSNFPRSALFRLAQIAGDDIYVLQNTKKLAMVNNRIESLKDTLDEIKGARHAGLASDETLQTVANTIAAWVVFGEQKAKRLGGVEHDRPS